MFLRYNTFCIDLCTVKAAKAIVDLNNSLKFLLLLSYLRVLFDVITPKGRITCRLVRDSEWSYAGHSQYFVNNCINIW